MWILWLSTAFSTFVQNLRTSETRQILLSDITKCLFLSCRDNKTEQLIAITIWSRKCTSVNSAATTRSYQSDIRELIHVSDLWSPCGSRFLSPGFPPQDPQLLIFHIRVIECHNTVCSQTLALLTNQNHFICKTHTHMHIVHLQKVLICAPASFSLNNIRVNLILQTKLLKLYQKVTANIFIFD